MKTLVIGLDGVTPELLFGDERLVNVRRLMAYGCYGLLEGAVSPTPALAWTSLSTSQGLGSLARGGQSGGAGRPRDGSQRVDPESMSGWTIWDQVTREGGYALLVDVPPSFPPREVDGVSVSFAVPAGSSARVYTHPAFVHQEIVEWVGRYPLAVDELNSEVPELLAGRIRDLSRDRFAVVRHLMQGHQWDYLQYVESGLTHLQSSKHRHQGPQRSLDEPSALDEAAIHDYYRFLDGELEGILEALDEDTIVLVVCLPTARGHHQAQRGGFVLAASNSPLQGEIAGAHLPDLAPTLLDLAGYEIPGSMQGRSLVAGRALDVAADAGLQDDEKDLLRERLSGLGYL